MLHADLMVNGERIGYVHARRVSPDWVPLGSGSMVWCRYEWRLNVNGVSVASDEPLEHRYGDGAWALIARVVAAAGRLPDPPKD